MKKYISFILLIALLSAFAVSADNSIADITLQYKEEFENYNDGDVPNWEISGNAVVTENTADKNKALKIDGKTQLQKQFGKIKAPFVAEFSLFVSDNSSVTLGFVNDKFYTEDFITISDFENDGISIESNKLNKITFVISNKTAKVYIDDTLTDKKSCSQDEIRGLNFSFSDGSFTLDNVYVYGGETMYSRYDIMPFSEKFETKLSDAVILLVDSNEALVNGEFKKTDENSSDVKPVIKESRTYVPLRFVAEAFGIETDWEAQTQKITLKGGDTSVSLTLGNASVNVNGTDLTIDAVPYITDGRTMVPIRAVSEALGKYVFWDESGLIVIADENKFENPENPTEKALISKLNDKMHRTKEYTDEDGTYILSEELMGDKISVASVTASANDGNVPENTIDGNLMTRWSAEFEQWIMFDLGEEKYVDNIAVAWSGGAKRKAVYDIEVSSDNINWKRVFSGKSSGQTEKYEITYLKENFRYLKYLGHGNTSSGWNSITEFNFFGN